ncbi:MAG: hypothetical protein IKY75_04060 [Bacteroidaceae bacterium]|nr:hypothetical protein [Bacteroidaceae bacterium]
MTPPKHLYLFAPENDMALAFGGRYYTPTPVAQAIARDLSLLPLWYAQEPHAQVWASQAVEPAMQDILTSLGVTAQATSKPQPHTTECHPWGWSAYIVDKLTRNGIDSSTLPCETAIDTIRTLSGRATSRTIIQELAKELSLYPLPPMPEVLRSDNEVEQYVTSQAHTILKAPWSSSGRGVWRVNGTYDPMTARGASGIIRKQGYIMGEVWQEKMCDLAMEFYSNGNAVEFAGYSLFTTDERGAYQSNLLASNSSIENILSQHIAPTTLHEVCRALEKICTQHIAPHYKGYMGIDMIVYRNARGEALLHPCIELNLRMSMGMVARIIADRYVTPTAQGTYHVHYAPDHTQLQALNQELSELNPLHIEHNKITSGYLALTPILPGTHYLAYINVKEK